MEQKTFSQNKTERLEIVQLNFAKWNDALKSGDPQKVAELYAEDATFLPTFSADLKIGKGEAEDYFEHFLKQIPVSEIVKEKIHFLGQEYYSHSGFYNFETGSENPKPITKARFTFIWGKNIKGEWEILEHHSSEMPKK